MISWIHLSDWHQKGPSFDRGIVRDALLKDILSRKQISDDLANLDFAVFSGDLAFSGKDGEYHSAKTEFIDPVLDACGLTPDRLLIVPGNHDVDRSLVKGLNITLSDFPDRESLAAS